MSSHPYLAWYYPMFPFPNQPPTQIPKPASLQPGKDVILSYITYNGIPHHRRKSFFYHSSMGSMAIMRRYHTLAFLICSWRSGRSISRRKTPRPGSWRGRSSGCRRACSRCPRRSGRRRREKRRRRPSRRIGRRSRPGLRGSAFACPESR